jgi:hypothetical protein
LDEETSTDGTQMSDQHPGREPSLHSPEPRGSDPRHASQLTKLKAIATERASLDERERAAIDKAREFEMTWAQIATALGMHHRQGAQQRRRRLHQDPPQQGRLRGAPASTAQPKDAQEDLERIAEHAVDVARWARSQLVGLKPLGPRTGVLRDLDALTIDMRRRLSDLRNRGGIADQRNRDKDNNERPAWEHHLATGWEADTIDCAGKLRSIAERASDLARMHAQAVSDHNTASQARKARHPPERTQTTARTSGN